MNAIVFLGPSLSAVEASKVFPATYLPPVAQGDVLRAARERPLAIGIIDGYFDRVPAVWHKEILWAMSQGIHVLGAASMGALRAVELKPFGMEGVGAIYEAFSSGSLTDDDEVAVAHGDEASGYRVISEAMVNIRATLQAAERRRTISDSTRAKLESIAKSLFYPERTYAQLVKSGLEAGLHRDELDALRAFIRTSRVDQKRADALSLLEALESKCAANAPRPPVTFSFARTEAWEQVVDWVDSQVPIGIESEVLPANLLAAEVRLSGAAGRPILQMSVNRAMASALATRAGFEEHSERFEKTDRAMRGLAKTQSSETFEQWLEGQGLSGEAYSNFLRREADLDWSREQYCEFIDHYVPDELVVKGEYHEVVRRALRKNDLLRRHGLTAPELARSGLELEQLIIWYFKEALQCERPRDMHAFLRSVGLRDLKALEHEALREFCYRQLLVAVGEQDAPRVIGEVHR